MSINKYAYTQLSSAAIPAWNNNSKKKHHVSQKNQPVPLLNEVCNPKEQPLFYLP